MLLQSHGSICRIGPDIYLNQAGLDTALYQCIDPLTVKLVNRPMPGTRLSSGGMLMASISRLYMCEVEVSKTNNGLQCRSLMRSGEITDAHET